MSYRVHFTVCLTKWAFLLCYENRSLTCKHRNSVDKTEYLYDGEFCIFLVQVVDQIQQKVKAINGK